ncbi:multiple inositol polyphosphate phosphatase 1-like [Petromyzon marinus]|uniref:Multiple inositol polyphosphate phosphatase 1 n=1 Tax=Petromyzon marinus TaxID=7757 RepID=A0AAJ7TYM8_PETMA|nr:multiple inositol polyphosphate phosphatase 1-like [Petromyzon marinus]XP_032825032.1 multiple inositol polyphosphate phosphatase 1-like [Petromyzon marinus]XP_032825034.1 multiple inositol polyphosphate phosphatase 1-like [Petromyzon marinus]XP_032825035.1 multiple inositol polyphosphate phosphatase 1-like [Petromyzon marinus]
MALRRLLYWHKDPMALVLLLISLFIKSTHSLEDTANTPPCLTPLCGHFGTKTRYEDVSKFSGWVGEGECRAIHLNAVIRHGTRLPTARQIRAMRNMHQLMAAGTSALAWKIGEWHFWFREELGGELVEKGARDEAQLAERLAERFPDLLGTWAVNHKSLRFLSSSKPRCVQSATAFMHALWHHQPAHYPEITVDDRVMRFFDECERFVENVKENVSALYHVIAFMEGKEMWNVQQKISERIGVPQEHVTRKLIQAAFYVCSFELAVNGTHSTWCELFDAEDAKVLEYLGDLKHFWLRGRGYPINSRISCVLLQDIFTGLDQAVTERQKLRQVSTPAVLRFGHAETLIPLLTLLGFFKDKADLLYDNYSSMHDRNFRTSTFCPYASNLVFVLSQCEGLGSCERDEETNCANEGEDSTFYIQLYLNEIPLHLDACGATICPYHKFKNYYVNILTQFQFKSECETLTSNLNKFGESKLYL